MASTSASVIGPALISGARSYVATSRFDGTRMRSSPGNGSSTPPLKKYVTCAYFSVSATWSWRLPRRDRCAASESMTSGGKATAHRQLVGSLVLGQGRDVERAGDRRGRSRSKSGCASAWVSCRARSARKLRWTTTSPSARSARRPSITVGWMNSSPSPRCVRVGDGRCRASAARRPRAVDDRVVGALRPLPAAVAVHGAVAAVTVATPRAPAKRASSSGRNASAERGGVSRPSVKAWKRTRSGGRPDRWASSTMATRCSSTAWTPPGPDEAHEVEAAAALGDLAAGAVRAPRCRRTSRRRWPR